MTPTVFITGAEKGLVAQFMNHASNTFNGAGRIEGDFEDAKSGINQHFCYLDRFFRFYSPQNGDEGHFGQQ